MKRNVQVIGVCAVLFGVTCLGRAEEVENDKRSGDGLKHLQQLGADITFKGMSFNERSLGKSVVFVRLNETWRGSIDDLSLLEGLGSGGELHVTFYGKRFTDQWLEAVSKNERIVGLQLNRTSMTAEGMKHVESMNHLRGVDLLYCDLNDDCLKHFDREPSLKFFYAFGSEISKAAFDVFTVRHPKCNARYARGGFLGIGAMAYFKGVVPGCLVTSVTPKGAAQKAGIQKMDLITKFNGNPVSLFVPTRKKLKPGGNQNDKEWPALSELIAQNAAGDLVMITVVRDGAELIYAVELGEWP